MVHHPYVYAEMLKARLLKHGVTCWLVNTGWTGGPFGVGKRISIRHTRALLNAALSGKLARVPFRQDPVFGFEVPTNAKACRRRSSTPNPVAKREEYFAKYRALAARFIENFKLMKDGCPEQIVTAGPRIETTPA